MQHYVLAIPLLNAEAERFLFMWRIFSKDWQSMNIKTIENIFWLCLDQDYSPQRYDYAIELFLSEYTDGIVRKGKCQVDGVTTFKKCPKIDSTKSISEVLDDLVPDPDDIPLSDISDNDEWSSTEDDDEF